MELKSHPPSGFTPKPLQFHAASPSILIIVVSSEARNILVPKLSSKTKHMLDRELPIRNVAAPLGQSQEHCRKRYTAMRGQGRFCPAEENLNTPLWDYRTSRMFTRMCGLNPEGQEQFSFINSFR